MSKTGFTNSAGHCLVMSTVMNKRPVAFVVLDAFGKYTHMADANRLKKMARNRHHNCSTCRRIKLQKKAKQKERQQIIASQ